MRHVVFAIPQRGMVPGSCAYRVAGFFCVSYASTMDIIISHVGFLRFDSAIAGSLCWIPCDTWGYTLTTIPNSICCMVRHIVDIVCYCRRSWAAL
jgi:hypothetical protein